MHRLLHILVAALLPTISAVAAEYSGTLPVMHITTQGEQPVTSKDYYLDATYFIDALGLPGYQSVGSPDEPLAMQIKGRGNYTWKAFDKKPYRIKLAKKTELLGMKKNRHFALLAHADDSYGFLRNPVGFYLSRALGMPWTPAEQPVEVMLNGKYIGLYFLTETIRVDADRVDITEQPDMATAPDEITGGWLVEIDNYYNDPHILIKEGDGADIVVTYKSPEELSQQQTAYLTAQFEAMNSAIYSHDTDICGWASMIDIPVLARFYVVQEIVDNYESFHGSCYVNKQRGEQEKWMFGPVWDFGSAFNYDKSQYIYQGREHHMTWIGQMCRFPEFMTEVKRLWRDFYSTGYYDMLNFVQQYADKIAEAAKADYKRWPQYGNADEQAKATLVKQRLRSACAWLARQWGGCQQPADLAPVTVNFINDDPDPWAKVYAYSWDYGPNGGPIYQLFGSWPGTEMMPTTIAGLPAYTITASPTQELSDTPGLIFDNGGSGHGNQTADLTLYNGHTYRRDGSHSSTADIADDDGLRIRSIGTKLVVTSPVERTVRAVRIDGTHTELHLLPGDNAIDLPRGFYIIGASKIAVR